MSTSFGEKPGITITNSLYLVCCTKILVQILNSILSTTTLLHNNISVVYGNQLPHIIDKSRITVFRFDIPSTSLDSLGISNSLLHSPSKKPGIMIASLLYLAIHTKHLV